MHFHHWGMRAGAAKGSLALDPPTKEAAGDRIGITDH
jgi:hypothetical protein